MVLRRPSRSQAGGLRECDALLHSRGSSRLRPERDTCDPPECARNPVASSSPSGAWAQDGLLRRELGCAPRTAMPPPRVRNARRTISRPTSPARSGGRTAASRPEPGPRPHFRPGATRPWYGHRWRATDPRPSSCSRPIRPAQEGHRTVAVVKAQIDDAQNWPTRHESVSGVVCRLRQATRRRGRANPAPDGGSNASLPIVPPLRLC